MFAVKLKNIASIIAVVCVCAGFCACSNLDSSKTTTAKTVTSNNTNSVYVASQTDVAMEDTAPTVTTATTVTTVKTTTPTPDTSKEKTVTTKKTSVTTKKTTEKTTTTTKKHSETVEETTTTKPETVTTTTVVIKEPEIEVVTNPVDNAQLILEGMSDGDKAVYDKISEAVDGFVNVVEFEYHTVTQTQVENSLLLISLAKLESSYVSTKYVISVDDMGYVSKLELEYTKTEEQHQEESEELEAVVMEIINGCKAKDDYGVLKYFHDEIIKRCVYDVESENMLNAYGCLVEGKAVCEGYAKAFMLLCSRYGIECVPVVGTTTDSNGEAVAHMWNMVKIGEKWYHIDLTWDDPITTIGDDFIKYDYFALSDEEISQDHMMTNLVHFVYPVADDGDNDYFEAQKLTFERAEVAVAVLGNLLITASDEEERFVRIRIENEEEFEKLKAMLFEADENGVKQIFTMLNKVSSLSKNEFFNPRRYSKVISEEKNIITIILNFE